ncbi:flagellar hook-length control protein FliK [Hyphobacterium sp.]|uniref:flagellar hook-length control protein FliK n=1 Tax=Hyphobacterium sp. TaxID=2004662 RepID=UPI003B51D00C
MDAQFAILSGQTATTGNGQSAASPAENGDFDVLLAAANGVMPVAPVQPVSGRSAMPTPHAKGPQSSPSSAAPAIAGSGGAPNAGSLSAGTESILTAIGTNGLPASASGLAAAGGMPASGQQGVPAIETQILAAQSGQPTQQTAQPGAQLNAVPMADGSANAGVSQLAASSQPAASAADLALAVTGMPNAPAAQAAAALPQGTNGVESAATSSGSKLPSALPSAAKISAAPTAGSPAGTLNKNAAGLDVAVQTAAVGGELPPSALAPQTPPSLTGAPVPYETVILPALQPEAGVQARRAADGGLTPPLPKTATPGQAKAALPAASAASSSAAISVSLPKAAPALPQQAVTPDVLPQTAMDDAAASKTLPDGRATAPISTDTQSQPADTDADGIELGQARSAETARAAERPGTAAGSARFTPANAGTLAAQIAAKFQNGERRFEIRMDPPELGRVAVRMQVGHDNRVHAVLSADRPETLQDMRQHVRELERALNEAGLELGEDGLSFELSQDREDTPNEHAGGSAFSDLSLVEDRAGDVVAALPASELYGFRLASSGGVDIRL